MYNRYLRNGVESDGQYGRGGPYSNRRQQQVQQQQSVPPPSYPDITPSFEPPSAEIPAAVKKRRGGLFKGLDGLGKFNLKNLDTGDILLILILIMLFIESEDDEILIVLALLLVLGL